MSQPLNTLGGAIDITAVWHRHHAHLLPSTAHLPLANDQYVQCDLCGAAHAFHLRAHVRVGADRWVNEGLVTYCPACRAFSLAASYVQSLQLLPGDEVTAVDARLWSSAPTFLNIEPTTRCNFNCWYCVGRHMEQADIKVEDFGAVLDHFPSLQAIALVGEGEPLLHKGFFEMAKMARDRGIRVLMISNGSAFSQSVVRKLCEAEVAYVSISIDSIDPETFASSRLDGDLNRIWEGIEKLVRYRDENGFKYPRIGLKGTLFSHTKNELPAIVAEAKRHGVDIFEGFQPLNPMASYIRIYPKAQLPQLASVDPVHAQILKDSHWAVTTQMESAESFCASEGIQLGVGGKPNGLRANCDERWLYSLLSGDVTPCCQVKQVLDPAWNLTRHHVDEILHNAHYENTRFNLWNGLFPDYCQGCAKTRQPVLP